jgi:hypothetical protein
MEKVTRTATLIMALTFFLLARQAEVVTATLGYTFSAILAISLLLSFRKGEPNA